MKITKNIADILQHPVIRNTVGLISSFIKGARFTYYMRKYRQKSPKNYISNDFNGKRKKNVVTAVSLDQIP